MVVEVSLILEFAATGLQGAVLGQFGHIVDERVEEIPELCDFNKFFLRCDFLLKYELLTYHYSIQVVAQTAGQLIKPFHKTVVPVFVRVRDLLQVMQCLGCYSSQVHVLKVRIFQHFDKLIKHV